MTIAILFNVEGWPRPQPRPRRFQTKSGGLMVTSNFDPAAVAWKEHCRKYARAHYRDRPIPAGEFLRVTFGFFIPRPKNPKWRFPCRPQDGDLRNLIVGTEDALKGIVWTDDRFIVKDGGSFKAFCPPGVEPGCLIRIENI